MRQTPPNILGDHGHAEPFAQLLLRWFHAHKRDLPWRNTGDPYAIWVSEVMLQQTRVAAVIPYYERFLARFPDVCSLAAAPEQDLLAHWAGLGYYSRARNMQKAAKVMAAAGGFSCTHDTLRELPGIGDYTAAAVASIAFGLPHAVVDGNVLRVLSRLKEDATDIGQPKAAKHFRQIAESLLDRQRPGDFNQAVMELGATLCLPRAPQCLLCPVASLCAARHSGRQEQFPVKKARLQSVEQPRTVYWIEEGGRVLAWQRANNERLMPGFWELPEPEHIPSITPGKTLGAFRHGITFHKYVFTVVAASAPLTHDCQWLQLADLHSRPISTIFRKALRLVGKANQGVGVACSSGAS